MEGGKRIMDKDVFDEIESFFKTAYYGWDGAEQFDGSGDRLRRLFGEMCWTRSQIDSEVQKYLKAVFPDPFDEMLVCKNINVWTLCPHHLLPCNFKVYIGYIPNGKVLGLSKFARVAVTLAKNPIMQEQYTREIVDTLWDNLNPDGLGVYVIGKHGCIGCRGVGQELDIVTSKLVGSFFDDQKTREEFFSICRT